MARKFGKCKSGGPVTSSTGEKILAVITPPANGKIAITSIRISGKGNNPAATPTEYYAQHGAVTGGSGGTSATAAAVDSADSAAIQTNQTTGWSTPPTIGGTPVELFRVAIHPQTGYVHREEIRITTGRPFVLFCNAASAHDLTWEVGFEE